VTVSGITVYSSIVESGNFNRHIESHHCPATFFVSFFVLAEKDSFLRFRFGWKTNCIFWLFIFFGQKRKKFIYSQPLPQNSLLEASLFIPQAFPSIRLRFGIRWYWVQL